MRKIIVIIASVIVLLVAVYIKNDTRQTVLPPTRTGNGEIRFSFAREYPFETAFSEADVVARIEIGNWLGEDNEYHITLYEARTLECYKGNVPETFTFLQMGSSDAAVKGYPLHINGNEVLVFMKETEVEGYDSVYLSIGAFRTVLYILYDESGTPYYVDRFGILGDTMEITTNYAHKEEIVSKIYPIAIESDPMWTELFQHHSYIFSGTDVVELLEEQQKN